MPKNKKNNLQIWLLAMASSILLSIPYLIPHTGLVSLIALVPLFLAEQLAHNSGKKHFFHIAYTSFLVWNLITTFWVWFATPGGAVGAFILNTLQMAIIFREKVEIFRFHLKHLFILIIMVESLQMEIISTASN